MRIHLNSYLEQLSDSLPPPLPLNHNPNQEYILGNLRTAYQELAERVYMALRVNLGDQHRLHSVRDEVMHYSTSAEQVSPFFSQ